MHVVTKKIVINAKDGNILEILILLMIPSTERPWLVEKSHKPSLLLQASWQLDYPNQEVYMSIEHILLYKMSSRGILRVQKESDAQLITYWLNRNISSVTMIPFTFTYWLVITQLLYSTHHDTSYSFSFKLKAPSCSYYQWTRIKG